MTTMKFSDFLIDTHWDFREARDIEPGGSVALCFAVSEGCGLALRELAALALRKGWSLHRTSLEIMEALQSIGALALDLGEQEEHDGKHSAERSVTVGINDHDAGRRER